MVCFTFFDGWLEVFSKKDQLFNQLFYVMMEMDFHSNGTDSILKLVWKMACIIHITDRIVQS